MSQADSGERSQYSAAGPALGYLTQVDYSLLLMLKRMDLDDDLEISIETLDDITFHHSDGTAAELIQTKHHINRKAALGDTSTDLWKTIHNWIESYLDHTAKLILITTARTTSGSAAHYLRDSDSRNPLEAARILKEIAKLSSHQGNNAYYKKFLALPEGQRQDLIHAITIIDGAPPAIELTKALIAAVRKTVSEKFREALVQRVRGWWHGRVMEHLTPIADNKRTRISPSEIEDILFATAQSLRDENLPIDFYEADEPTSDDVTKDTRLFVFQLRLIRLGSARIRQCI